MLPVSWSAWVPGISILRSAQRLHTHRSHHQRQRFQITQFRWVGGGAYSKIEAANVTASIFKLKQKESSDEGTSDGETEAAFQVSGFHRTQLRSEKKSKQKLG